MTITISGELEARLREKAAREGQDPHVVAESILLSALDLEATDRAETVEGIRRGLEASAAGQVTSLQQVIEEARERHGFPASWPDDSGRA
jgi:predicted transcriptional regulator